MTMTKIYDHILWFWITCVITYNDVSDNGSTGVSTQITKTCWHPSRSHGEPLCALDSDIPPSSGLRPNFKTCSVRGLDAGRIIETLRTLLSSYSLCANTLSTEQIQSFIICSTNAIKCLKKSINKRHVPDLTVVMLQSNSFDSTLLKKWIHSLWLFSFNHSQCANAQHRPYFANFAYRPLLCCVRLYGFRSSRWITHAVFHMFFYFHYCVRPSQQQQQQQQPNTDDYTVCTIATETQIFR